MTHKRNETNEDYMGESHRNLYWAKEARYKRACTVWMISLCEVQEQANEPVFREARPEFPSDWWEGTQDKGSWEYPISQPGQWLCVALEVQIDLH